MTVGYFGDARLGQYSKIGSSEKSTKVIRHTNKLTQERYVSHQLKQKDLTKSSTL